MFLCTGGSWPILYFFNNSLEQIRYILYYFMIMRDTKLINYILKQKLFLSFYLLFFYLCMMLMKHSNRLFRRSPAFHGGVLNSVLGKAVVTQNNIALS